MKHVPRPLPVLLAVLFLVGGVLSAENAGSSSGGRALKISLGDRGVIERSQRPAGTGQWHGFPISLSLRDAPLQEVLRTFARLAGFNLVLDSRVQGSVTVEFKDVPWDQALSVILKTYGLGAEIDDRLWLIAPGTV